VFQVKKVSMQGTSEPWIARLWIGILELRDQALNSLWRGSDLEKHRSEFDLKYDPVLTALKVSLKASQTIEAFIADHSSKVASGAIVKFGINAVSFSENIDLSLHDATAKLLVNGVIALKGAQEITEMFGVNIGGLFQKQPQFERAMGELDTVGHSALAAYLRETRRVWSERFIQQRSELEHQGWTLPPVKYIQSGSTSVEIREPTICDLPVSEFAKLNTRRLFSFVENIVICAFKTSFSGPMTIVEIPPDKRDPNIPRRFRVYVKGHDKPEWFPKYNDGDFP
jgi:hypothetical protein